MIRHDFIKRKLSLIQDELAKLATLSQYSISEVTSDFVKQAAVERFLERVINRALDINQYIISEFATKDILPPQDYRGTFLILATLGIFPKEFADAIVKSIGTRNMLAHEYDNVDLAFVYHSIADCLRDYQKYVEYILAFLDKTL